MHFPSILLAFLLFCAIPSASEAQFTLNNVISLRLYSDSLHSNAQYPTVTRFIYPQSALTYYEHGHITGTPPTYNTWGCFNLNRDGFDIYSFDLPDKVYATDFMNIPNSSVVVFCGYKNYSVSSIVCVGVVGWFNIPHDTVPVQVNYIEVPEAYTFRKVCGFYFDQALHISAIALRQGDYHTEIFHTSFASYMPNPLNYNLYPTHPGVNLRDIVRTCNYIAFIGTDGYNFCIQREKPQNMDAPVMLQEIVGFDMQSNLPILSIHTTYLGNKMNRQGDTIAVSTPLFVSKTNYQARFHTIDLDIMQPICTQRFADSIQSDVDDLAYVAGTKQLCAIYYSELSHPSTPVVLLDPIAVANYSAPTFTEKTHGYSFLDCMNLSINSVRHLLCGNMSSWYVQDLQYVTGGRPCFYYTETNIETMHRPLVYYESFPMVGKYSAPLDTISRKVEKHGALPDCSEVIITR